MGHSEKISVVVLVHNKISMSETCLNLLSEAVSDLDHEVVLLDNASTEDAGILCGYRSKFGEFKCIRNQENLPFSIANNRAVNECSGRYLLFLNNDVYLRRDTVSQLLACLKNDSSAGAAGGKLLFPGEQSVQHAGVGHMLWGHPCNYGVGASPNDWRIQEAGERFALTGAMLGLRREAFEEVGGFDVRYIWGIEDIDLCLKIRSAGYKTLYCPTAVGIHLESATLKIDRNSDPAGNYRIYRQTWEPMLASAEQRYASCLRDQGISRVAVFGTGMAARGLTRVLDENGIRVEAFTSSAKCTESPTFLGRPNIPLDRLSSIQYDRLMVASQFFFEVEDFIRPYDPLHQPIYPFLN